jgi:hypothetical protein
MSRSYLYEKSARALHPLTAVLAAVLVLGALGGCARAIVEGPNAVPVAARDYAGLFQASILVLRDEGFIINRQDFRFGIMNTRPLASPTAYEPWQRQNTTAYQAWESTFNYERRTVTVTLEPAGSPVGESASTSATQPAQAPLATAAAPPPSYILRVEVLIERQQNPTQQMTGSSSGHAVVADLSATPADLAERGITDKYWLPITRDPYMERQLVAEILRRAAEAPPPATAPANN